MEIDECRRAFELYLFGNNGPSERCGDNYVQPLASNYWVIWRAAWAEREKC